MKKYLFKLLILFGYVKKQAYTYHFRKKSLQEIVTQAVERAIKKLIGFLQKSKIQTTETQSH
jgi:hypothetical protein